MGTTAASTHADTLPIGRAMLLAAGVATVLALAVSAAVYLSMLHHGHSFARMFGWQPGNWGFWALLAPLVLKTGERLGGQRATRLDVVLWLLAGLALIAMHALVAATVTVSLRPFYPLESGTFTGALLGQLPSMVIIARPSTPWPFARTRRGRAWPANSRSPPSVRACKGSRSARCAPLLGCRRRRKTSIDSWRSLMS